MAEDALDHELDDLESTRTFDWSLIDRALLSHPIVVRAAAGALLVLAFLLWPERGQIVATRLVALAIVVSALTVLWSSLRRGERSALRIVGAVAALALGAVLLASADQRPQVLGRTLGAVSTIAGAAELLRLVRSATRTPGSVVRAALLAAAGVLLLIWPTTLFTTIAIAFGVAWAFLGFAAISVSLNPNTPSVAAYGSSQELLDAWFTDRPKGAARRRDLYDKILYEGVDMHRRIVRFVVLMTFASIIASMGVINDSTAVVIGAMLIAPLMTPLMGMAISLVMGWPRRLARSSAIALLGIAIAIGIGALLGLTVPAIIDTAANSQILSRTSPTTLDLIVAIAAGGAGAYALSRPDVSDSLPGVAIAISLVPPLTVVGLSYSQGDWRSGNGALLLYATNMLAILVVGGIVFIATGVTPLSRVADNQHRLRTWGAALGAAAALIVGALLLNGAQLAQDALAQDRLEQVVSDWIDESPSMPWPRLSSPETRSPRSSSARVTTHRRRSPWRSGLQKSSDERCQPTSDWSSKSGTRRRSTPRIDGSLS